MQLTLLLSKGSTMDDATWTGKTMRGAGLLLVAIGCQPGSSGLTLAGGDGGRAPASGMDAGSRRDAQAARPDSSLASTIRIRAPARLAVDEGRTGSLTAITAESSAGGAVVLRLGREADASPFALGPLGGELVLTEPLDFETPTDANEDNVYELVITAEDRLATMAMAQLEVHVIDRQSVGGRAFDIVFPPPDSILEGVEETVVTIRRHDDGTTPIFVEGIVAEQRPEPFTLWSATVPVGLGRNTIRATIDEAGPLGIESAEVSFDNIPQNISTLPVPEAGGALLLPTRNPPYAHWLDMSSHRITRLSDDIRTRLSGFDRRSGVANAFSYREWALDGSQGVLRVVSKIREGSSVVGLRVDEIDPRLSRLTELFSITEVPFDLEQGCPWLVITSVGPERVAILCHTKGFPPSESWLALGDSTSGEVAWRAVSAFAIDVEPFSTTMRLWDGERLRALDLVSGELSTLRDLELSDPCWFETGGCDARHVDLRAELQFARHGLGLAWSLGPFDTTFDGFRARFEAHWGLHYEGRYGPPLTALDRRTGQFWVASRRQILAVDPAAETLELLWGGAGSGVPARRLSQLSPDLGGGKRLALQRNWHDGNSHRLIEIDMRTGRRTSERPPLQVQDGSRRWTTARGVGGLEYDSAGRRAFFVGWQAPAERSLVSLALDTGESTVLAPSSSPATSLWLDESSNTLASCALDADEVTALHLVTGSTRTVATFPRPIRCVEIVALEPTRRELVAEGRVWWRMDDGWQTYGLPAPVLMAFGLDGAGPPRALFGTNVPHVGNYHYWLDGPEVPGELGILGPGGWDGYRFRYALLGPIEGEPGALMVVDREAEELQRLNLSTRALEPIMAWPNQDLLDLFKCGTVDLDTDLCIEASNHFQSTDEISVRDLPSRQRAIIAY
jgi:hypothetical protein